MDSVKINRRERTFKFACVLFDVDKKAAIAEMKNVECEIVMEVGAKVNAKWGDEWLSAELLFMSSK